MRKIFIYLILWGVGSSILFYILDGKSGSISSLVAYFSSLLIVLASLSSYKKMVESRLDAGIIPAEDRDELDKIEDPHRLYEDIETKDATEILKEEKARLKQNKRGVKESIKDSLPAFSPIKIISYIILAGGFIWLKNSGIMVLYAYLISLIIPIVVIIYLLMQKR